MIFDPLYFLLLAPAMLLGLWAQFKVKSAYHRGRETPSHSGMTGAETARYILDQNGLREVAIELSHGMLSDHYDPRHKVLRLSPDVAHGRDVAALGIAAHEAGHALQDAQHYGPLKIRNGIVPLAGIGSNLSFLLLILGLALGGAASAIGGVMVWAGVGLFSTVVLFQLINLPVEFDASRRAKLILVQQGLVAPGPEQAAMERVLGAAALTYVAATLTAILTLVYFLLRATQSRD